MISDCLVCSEMNIRDRKYDRDISNNELQEAAGLARTHVAYGSQSSNVRRRQDSSEESDTHEDSSEESDAHSHSE